MLHAIRQDIRRYKRSPTERGLVALVHAVYCHPAFYGVLWYRLSHYAWTRRRRPLQRVLSTITRLLYPLIRMLSGLDLPASAAVGPGLWVGHYGPTVIHPDAQIGAGATLLHGVTIGEDRKGVPILGDNVSVGAGATLVGPIHVGNGAIVGAHSVVTRDVPAHHLAVGIPARVHAMVSTDDYSQALLGVVDCSVGAEAGIT